MSASPEPTGDVAACLAAVRALWGDDMALMQRVIEYGEMCNAFAVRAATEGEVSRAETALREHIATHYVRRDRLVPDEWDHLDTTAPPAEECPGPPGDLSALRRAYFRGDGPTLADVKGAEATARAARYGKEELEAEDA